jgi:hypothetical protein
MQAVSITKASKFIKEIAWSITIVDPTIFMIVMTLNDTQLTSRNEITFIKHTAGLCHFRINELI